MGQASTAALLVWDFLGPGVALPPAAEGADTADFVLKDRDLVGTGRRLWRSEHSGNAEDIWALRWSEDGRLLASTADDATAIVWDPATGAVTERLALGETKVRGLAFSSDGQTLFTGGEDRSRSLMGRHRSVGVRVTQGGARGVRLRLGRSRPPPF